MIRIKRDIEELVALADVFNRCKNKTQNEVKEELSSLSSVLNYRADRLGIAHDEKFRNVNGMNMTYQNMVYVMTNGQQGLLFRIKSSGSCSKEEELQRRSFAPAQVSAPPRCAT